MNVTLEQIESLRETLVTHRLEHEAMAARIQWLVARNREMRAKLKLAYGSTTNEPAS